MMKIGIEHEFVFKNEGGDYLDFENTEYLLFKHIVDMLPYVKNDERYFECKSLEKVPKRCYIEGFERYTTEGEIFTTVPMGLEIRTLPHATIDAVVSDFGNTYAQMQRAVASFGLTPLLTSCHPYKKLDSFKQPLNDTEKALRTDARLASVYQSMLLHGLHVNVSIDTLLEKQMLDLIHKVNYYAAFIIPFSFSSPFYNGVLFEGLCFRNFSRIGKRNLARLVNRKGIHVLEFTGFDSCGDKHLLKLLLLLLKGLLLDSTLSGRALAQDETLLKQSTLYGFESNKIKEGALLTLKAAKNVLKEEGILLEDLEVMIQNNDSYAVKMKQIYQKTANIMESISNRYMY